jgi:hypothetical protein
MSKVENLILPDLLFFEVRVGILSDCHEFIIAIQAFASKDSYLVLFGLLSAVCFMMLMLFLRGCKGLILEMALSGKL